MHEKFYSLTENKERCMIIFQFAGFASEIFTLFFVKHTLQLSADHHAR